MLHRQRSRTGVPAPDDRHDEHAVAGSADDRVSLPLRTGARRPPGRNAPITGSRGHLVIRAAGKIGEVAESSLVDNAFAAPGAKGCAGTLADAIVPAAAGR